MVQRERGRGKGRGEERERIDGTKRVCLRLLLHIVFVGGEGKSDGGK